MSPKVWCWFDAHCVQIVVLLFPFFLAGVIALLVAADFTPPHDLPFAWCRYAALQVACDV